MTVRKIMFLGRFLERRDRLVIESKGRRIDALVPKRGSHSSGRALHQSNDWRWPTGALRVTTTHPRQATTLHPVPYLRLLSPLCQQR